MGSERGCVEDSSLLNSCPCQKTSNPKYRRLLLLLHRHMHVVMALRHRRGCLGTLLQDMALFHHAVALRGSI
jgi:hypothetical protein